MRLRSRLKDLLSPPSLPEQQSISESHLTFSLTGVQLADGVSQSEHNSKLYQLIQEIIPAPLAVLPLMEGFARHVRMMISPWFRNTSYPPILIEKVGLIQRHTQGEAIWLRFSFQPESDLPSMMAGKFELVIEPSNSPGNTEKYSLLPNNGLNQWLKKQTD
jgi:hypothetical protein